MPNYFIRKSTLLIFISLFFFISYYFKSLPLFLFALSLTSLFGFFFKFINKNILFILFSILFSLFIIETTLLYYTKGYIIKAKTSKNFSTNIKYKKSYLGYQPIPGIHNYKVISNGKIIIDKYYTINEDGFRMTPKINNLKATKSINFFGGSFTFGYGLNDDQTLPYYVQNYFTDWKVNNYGISGYGVHQMLAQIIKEPNILSDINILVTDSGHIPRVTCKRDFSFGTPKFILNEKKEVIKSGNCNFISAMDHIPVPRIIGSIINRSMIKNRFLNIYQSKNYYDDESVELYIKIIKKINDIVDNNQKKFFIGFMNSTDEIDKKLIQILKKNNIDLIDLSLDLNNKKYWLPDTHTSAEGNKKRADIIYNYLNNLGFKNIN